MGRIGLRRLLIGGLVSILLLSLVLSALGVGFMVRNYLWRTGARELEGLSRPVQRILELREDRRDSARLRNFMRRGMRRLNRGRGRVLLLRQGRVVQGNDESGVEWGTTFQGLAPGISLVQVEGESYQVLLQQVENSEYDEFVIVRPWSPSQKVLRALMTYQVLATCLVLGLAGVAVSALARKLAAPLEELREWSERIGADQVDGELDRSPIREVASLQRSFQEMGQRVDEALVSQRQFVADASHELKTPLTAIAGMLELMESQPGMDEQDRRKALAVAKVEADRMKRLVADLLVLSRAQAKHSGERQEIELAKVAEEQIQTLEMLFPEQSFVRELEPGLTWQLNRDALARVVRNLVENAARYAGGEPIVVRVGKNEEGLFLQVEDRGPGISEEVLPHLFERFYRVDKGRSRDVGGFGLGLPIVKALAEEVGGELFCKSRVGEGTTFTVVFRPDGKDDC